MNTQFILLDTQVLNLFCYKIKVHTFSCRLFIANKCYCTLLTKNPTIKLTRCISNFFKNPLQDLTWPCCVTLILTFGPKVLAQPVGSWKRKDLKDFDDFDKIISAFKASGKWNPNFGLIFIIIGMFHTRAFIDYCDCTYLQLSKASLFSQRIF